MFNPDMAAMKRLSLVCLCLLSWSATISSGQNGGTLKDRSKENPGAAPKPNTVILDVTKDRALLQCEARGAPRPKVEWKNSSGNILPAEEPQVSERGGSFYVTLNTTVTKNGRYRCVATQKEINHQIYAETVVGLNGHSSGVHGSDQTSRKVMIAVAVGVLAELLFL